MEKLLKNIEEAPDASHGDDPTTSEARDTVTDLKPLADKSEVKKKASAKLRSLRSGALKTKIKTMSSWYDDKFMRPELLAKFSKQQLAEYRAAYKMFDQDSNGVISVAEVITVLRSLGQDPSENEVEMLFAKYDKDGSGEIEFPEFISLVSLIQENEDKEEDLVDVFRALDVDGDGFITKKDLREVIRTTGSSLTSLDVQAMIDEADDDGGGTIEFEEFVKLILTRS